MCIRDRLYLAMMDATKKWTGKAWDWGLTLDQLCIYFGDRIQPEDIDVYKRQDHRRRIDIPGYNRILLHPATRFIGTMNYGYAGTRELNEALVSRFMVIDMPEMDEDSVLFRCV